MMARMGDAMAQASFTGATRRAWLAAAACALASGLLSPAMADPSAQQYDMVLQITSPSRTKPSSLPRGDPRRTSLHRAAAAFFFHLDRAGCA